MKWMRSWIVLGSKSGTSWKVSVADDDSWGCSCPVWKFRRQECHHIRQVKDDLASPHFTNGKALPEILPGRVSAVKIIDGKCLYPLIPFNDYTSDILATIVYDLLGLGYPMSRIRKRFNSVIPSSWTVQGVQTHVVLHGRVLCPTTKYGHYQYVGKAKGKEDLSRDTQHDG